jgi:GTP cyclohydrolase I
VRWRDGRDPDRRRGGEDRRRHRPAEGPPGAGARIVAAYADLLDGYEADVGGILNDIARERPGLVLGQGVNFTSIYDHHFRPFFGTMDIAYEPGEMVTGLGRIVELVQALAHGLQIQEVLVRDVAEAIREMVGANGVFVRSRAAHPPRDVPAVELHHPPSDRRREHGVTSGRFLSPEATGACGRRSSENLRNLSH